eukprot:TRINITY_DN46377_c0_g1_i1.p1 TRINITY_DN46377_c0_g1~~TRINITY_DN46377_c0_g1_i1.p1  ORF type:complete len:424 (+),score=123.33 TRINITY_DN46377_c0_g1_i1:82-1272(+)
MAPRGSTPAKRAAEETLEAEEELQWLAKRPRKGASGDMLEEVLAAVERADNISERGREMLMLMASGSIGPANDDRRHRYQMTVAQMLCDLLRDVDGEISAEVDEAARRIEATKEACLACAPKLTLAQEEVRRRGLAEDAARKAFTEDNLQLLLAHSRYAAAADARKGGEASARAASDLGRALESALRQNFPPLVEGTCKEAARHLEVLEPLIAKVPLDHSLVVAFPVAVKKALKDRGTFDRAAIDSMQKEIGKHQATLSKRAAELAAEVAELRSSEEAARAALDAVRDRQQVSAAALRVAECSRRKAECGVGTVDWERHEAEEATALARAQRSELLRELEDFRAGPLAHLRALCARQLQPEAPADAAAKPGTAAAKEQSVGVAAAGLPAATAAAGC